MAVIKSVVGQYVVNQVGVCHVDTATAVALDALFIHDLDRHCFCCFMAFLGPLLLDTLAELLIVAANDLVAGETADGDQHFLTGNSSAAWRAPRAPSGAWAPCVACR